MSLHSAHPRSVIVPRGGCPLAALGARLTAVARSGHRGTPTALRPYTVAPSPGNGHRTGQTLARLLATGVTGAPRLGAASLAGSRRLGRGCPA
jgi:hypothetical protein